VSGWQEIGGDERSRVISLCSIFMLPGEDGLSICRECEPLAGADHHAHGSGEDVDRIVGLELARDDYLAKPSIRRAALRIKACYAELLTRLASDAGLGARIPIQRLETRYDDSQQTARRRYSAPLKATPSLANRQRASRRIESPTVE